jgi:Cu-processing system permease protein
MPRVFVIVGLTLLEARRRRVLLATLVCGIVFLLAFATGLHFVHRDLVNRGAVPLLEQHMVQNFLLMAGLYGVNFLAVLTAVLLPVDTLSGEIVSGVMQSMVARPVRRWEIVIGKWAGHAIVLAGYLAVLSGGVLAIGRWTTGFLPPGIAVGLPLMFLEGVVFLTLVIALGSRVSTVTNGIVAFGLYGLAFVGNWTEQIGAVVGNDAARQFGTAASLVMPTEALWQLAAWHMQPPLMRELQLTPFSPASVPNGLMVLWAVGYVGVALASALVAFRKRDL